MFSAVTLSLVSEARGGPFVFWDSLASGCEQAAALGFDGVEIFPRAADEIDAREIKSLLSQHKLKLAAMGTGAGWVAHRLRLTDPDAAVRRRARDFVAAIIDLAGSFGAPAIIGSMQGRHEGDVTREQALAWLGEALEQLGPRAHAHGVPLLLEPLNRYETNLLRTVKESLDFLSGLRTQNVKLLCDLFHMNIEEADIAASLRLAGPKLGHVHFVDSNRLAAGWGHTGMVPVIQALREIGFSGFISAEVFPIPDGRQAAEQSIAAYKNLVGSV